jgi:hypothetical protein
MSLIIDLLVFKSLLFCKSDTCVRNAKKSTTAWKHFVEPVHYDHYSNSDCNGGGLDIPHPLLQHFLTK